MAGSRTEKHTAVYRNVKRCELKCGQISLSCAYMAKHKGCGGYYTVDFATKIYRERAKEKELA